MRMIQVFDPPMCCSTGVCGPTVDSKLTRFAADLGWLKSRGVTVQRFNLAQNPEMFVENKTVKQAVAMAGEKCLPLVLVDGKIACQGAYPSRNELAVMVGVDVADSTQRVASTKSGCCCASTGKSSPEKCC
jgi:arsenite methyltransferase